MNFVQKNTLLKDLLQRITQLKVLVIGDIMLDHYIWGDVHRISPEAPVPVVFIENDTYRLGGAANVALNVRSLGANVDLLGWIGDDMNGQILEKLLKDQNIGLCLPLFDRPKQTIVKTRVIARNQQLCRLDRDVELRPKLMPRLKEFIVDRLKSVHAVILSDYAKGTLSQSLVGFIEKEAEKRGIFLAIDPKPSRHLHYRQPSLLTPNRSEALQMAKLPYHESDSFDAESVAKAIYQKHRPKILVITLGKRGMAVFEEGKFVKQFETVAREVFDVSGAGDTVIAALTAALCAGHNLELSAYFANICAGIVVGKLGTASANPREVLEYET